jgi:hypothetical protein
MEAEEPTGGCELFRCEQDNENLVVLGGEKCWKFYKIYLKIV